jgi:thioredoxin 1
MADSQVVEFTDATFASKVLEDSGPVLVDFWAAWCGPCRAVSPPIEKLAERFAGQVKVGKLNVDENPKTAASLGISSIPSVLLFENGEVVETLIGVRTEAEYAAVLKRAGSHRSVSAS